MQMEKEYSETNSVLCIFCNEPDTDFECVERIHGIAGDAHEDCYRDFARGENKRLVNFMQIHGIAKL